MTYTVMRGGRRNPGPSHLACAIATLLRRSRQSFCVLQREAPRRQSRRVALGQRDYVSLEVFESVAYAIWDVLSMTRDDGEHGDGLRW